MAKIPAVSIIPVAKCYRLNSGTPTPRLDPMTPGRFTGSGTLLSIFHKRAKFNQVLSCNRPDHCNGGFDQYCDSGRKYSNISLILVDSGHGDLLEYMSGYWKDFRGDDSNLWQHEWNKHGTCVSTLETHCYEDYLPQQEVVDYFDRTVDIFKQLPSYEVGQNAEGSSMLFC